MDPNTLCQIKDAVLEHKPMAFAYGGKFRWVCAHMLGMTKDKGAVMHAYQYAGETSGGTILDPEAGEWKFMYLDKIEGKVAVFSGQPWYPADLQKAENQYKPPKFVARVLALATFKPASEMKDEDFFGYYKYND
jgi:hypothetical protein